jgi:hypothetical protein
MPDAAAVAVELAKRLSRQGVDYAFGGAIALAFAAEPRSTIDVDVTLFLDPTRVSAILETLARIGCDFDQSAAASSLKEHGFCRTSFQCVRVDVFLPTIPFYELARARRLHVKSGNEQFYTWNAETLAVFKMMFFRGKDLIDLERILEIQGTGFDRPWVRGQLVDIFGARDPRIAAWDDLAGRISAE